MAGLVVVAALLLAYALVSDRLRRTPLTAPMLFVAAGLLLGPEGTDTVHGPQTAEAFRLVLEAALVLILFTDAASLSGFSREEDRVPIRLLGIGLPLSIAFGWLFAKLLFLPMPLWEAALLGAVLAPTDAALGEAVIANRRVPRLIRDALNVESGLNDGLALPFVTVFAALAVEELHGGAEPGAVEVAVRAIVLSPLLGAVIGTIGAWLLVRALGHGWVAPVWGKLAVGALAVAAYAATASAHGSGFIGAWVAGFAAGKAGGEPLRERTELTEELGALLATLGFFAFGLLFLGPTISHLGWAAVGYAAASLFLVRPVPVAISLAGTGLRRPTVAYIGWFGPRGLASIVFLLLALEEGAATGPFVAAVAATVLASVFLHGATAVAGSDRYADWYGNALGEDPSLPEGAARGPDRIRRRRVR